MQVQTTDFQLNASSQAFKILSSSLYEDKERAVLRETVANAWDAHLAAGNSDPVTVTLPTPYLPNLIISDSGVGMSHSQLTGIYSTYFSSTKAADDNLIGGFGLGSKSPFAITDEFTITSTHNGEHTVVKAFLDAGSPKLDTISHEYNTNLPSGTKVTIPVPSHRRQEALKTSLYSDLFSYWATPPTITNDDPIESASRNIIGSTEVTITSGYSYRDMDLSNLILGEFKYNIPSSIVDRVSQADYLYPELVQYCKLLGSDSYSINVVITPILPIGSIELAPSRERIEDTEANYQTILEAVQLAGKELLPTAMSTLTTTTDMLHTLTLSVSTLDHYQAIVDYYTDLPESHRAMFEIAIKARDKSSLPDQVEQQLSALCETTFFHKGKTNHVESLPSIIHADTQINPTSYELTRSNAIKSIYRGSHSLIKKVANNETLYIHITDSPKANITKAIINHCIRNNISVNGDKIYIDDHYAITSAELATLTNLFTDNDIVVLTAELMAPYKPAKATSTKSTKEKSPNLGSIIYSSTGLQAISVADFYSLPSSTYTIVMPTVSDSDYYGNQYQRSINNYYIPLIRAVNPTREVLVIEVPRTELTNKRFKDCSNIGLIVNKDSSSPTLTAIKATTTPVLQSILHRMAVIEDRLLNYSTSTDTAVTNWLKTLFTSEQQELLNSNEHSYQAVLSLIKHTSTYPVSSSNLPPKTYACFNLVRDYLSKIEHIEDVVDFPAIAKLFHDTYED